VLLTFWPGKPQMKSVLLLAKVVKKRRGR